MPKTLHCSASRSLGSVFAKQDKVSQQVCLVLSDVFPEDGRSRGRVWVAMVGLNVEVFGGSVAAYALISRVQVLLSSTMDEG